jgi:hypothetical protein
MKYYLFFLFIIFRTPEIFSQPQPGDIFREYIWTTPDFERSEKFLRVGGRFDYNLEPEKFPAGYIKNGFISMPIRLDLEKAKKVEIQVEKNLCHEGTRGLSIKVNKSPWIVFPESDSIPEPQYNFLHHTYPVIEVPLNVFNDEPVMFSFRVDSVQEWNWPQNLIYGVILRVYYDEGKIKDPAELIQPDISDQTGEIKLNIKSGDPSGINSVIYIGKYLDVNYEGDGKYFQWHYNYYRGKRENYLAGSDSYPFNSTWDTGWVPDQENPVEIGALVKNKDGFIYFTEPVQIDLPDRNYSIILCKPFDQPEKWTTRAAEFSSKCNLPANPEDIMACQMVWASWSPCYANGI